MAQLISFVIGVVAFCITLCVANVQRAANLQIVSIGADLSVIVDTTMGNLIANKLQQIRPSAHAAKEYAQAFFDFKSSESTKSNDLEEKRYIAAQKLADLGFIIFVSGGPVNYIVVPAILKEDIVLLMYIRYVYAEIQPDEIEKDIKDAQVKQITKIDGGRIYYKALEFTSSQIFDTVVLTLGSVHFGEFYMESDKIKKHDTGLQTVNQIAKEKVSEMYNKYIDKTFVPAYDKGLEIKETETWVAAVGGKIHNILVKFIVEATVNGKKNLWEHEMFAEDLKTASFSLERYAAMFQKQYPKPKYTDVNVKYYFIFQYKKE